MPSAVPSFTRAHVAARDEDSVDRQSTSLVLFQRLEDHASSVVNHVTWRAQRSTCGMPSRRESPRSRSRPPTACRCLRADPMALAAIEAEPCFRRGSRRFRRLSPAGDPRVRDDRAGVAARRSRIVAIGTRYAHGRRTRAGAARGSRLVTAERAATRCTGCTCAWRRSACSVLAGPAERAEKVARDRPGSLRRGSHHGVSRMR
jgi:hypothetical protein